MELHLEEESPQIRRCAGQDSLVFDTLHKEAEDYFFDMSWLEGEDDWLSLKQEAESNPAVLPHQSAVIQKPDPAIQVPH